MEVVETKRAIKNLKKVSLRIQESYLFWKRLVQNNGLHKLREIKSYHYEALRGVRKGQYSCRLSREYRVIFEAREKEIIVKVLEVNKHEY